MTTSTIPARTVLEIRASIEAFGEMLDTIDARVTDLFNEPYKGDVFVVGYPQYGLYLNARGSLGPVLNARLMDAHAAARATVVNAAGEASTVVGYSHALDVALKDAQDARTAVCGVYQDLHAELVEAQAYERHLDDCAEHERVLADYRLDQRL